ncbi:hypothetical protein SODG_007278 [Sodalis praecaptivus]
MALHHDIELEVEEGIARFTLNKSATHNALSLDMLRALDAGLAQLEAREDIRCIVFSSASARFLQRRGYQRVGDIDPEKMGSLFIRAGNRVFRRIREMDVATIAIMSGHALGGVGTGAGLRFALCGRGNQTRIARSLARRHSRLAGRAAAACPGGGRQNASPRHVG